MTFKTYNIHLKPVSIINLFVKVKKIYKNIYFFNPYQAFKDFLKMYLQTVKISYN